MDVKDLRPKVFAADPESSDSKKQWLHWRRSFTTYIGQMGELSDENKLNLLINHLDASVFELISEVTTFAGAIDLLAKIYAKAPSPVFA